MGTRITVSQVRRAEACQTLGLRPNEHIDLYPVVRLGRFGRCVPLDDSESFPQFVSVEGINLFDGQNVAWVTWGEGAYASIYAKRPTGEFYPEVRRIQS